MVVNQPIRIINGASVFYTNARSIVNKLKDFQSLVYTKSFDIIGISETWLTDNIYDNEILPTGYTIFRKDRPSRGGGVLLAVNNTIPCQLISSPSNLEVVCIKLNLSHPITCCVLYNPPNLLSEYCDNLLNFISNISNSSDRLILLGDFNLPDINWNVLSGNSPVSNKLCDLIFHSGMNQLIDKPTHLHGNVLDLLLTNIEENITSLEIHSNSSLLSDHYDITFAVATVPKFSSKFTPYYTFNYSKGDYYGLSNYLLNTDFTSCFLTHDIERIWHTIEHQIITAMKLFIPVNKHHSVQHPPWFTPEIRHSLKQLRTLRRKYKFHPSQNNLAIIDSLEATIQEMISTAKLHYETSLISNFATANSNKIYKYLKSTTKSNCMPPTVDFDSSTASTDFDKANLFNHYFYSVFHSPSKLPDIDELPTISDSLHAINITITNVYEALISLNIDKSTGIDDISPRVLQSCAEALCEPLHHLFSLSLRYAIVPSSWKIHKVVPIFKAGDVNSVRNYRPISLLSNTSKVLERLIFNKMIDHVTKSISPLQFGFTKNCSTLQQMLIFINQVINTPSQTDVIYFDISKAFDTVSHSILLRKLWSIGITGTLWTWIKDYLTNRYQRVSINNCCSNLLPVVSGVPQGSILGPLLFIIFINDITSTIQHSQLLKFADDTKCFKSITDHSDQTALQEDINALITWSSASHLKFNLNKSVHLVFKSKIPTSYTMFDTSISHTDSHKDLGLVLSEDLSWSKHYNFITARAYKVLGLIRRTFSSSHCPNTVLKLYISLVRSQLFYCTQLWRPHLLKDIDNIERIQRRATKFILQDYTSSYKTRLLKLKLLPLMYLFEIQDILFAIKSLKIPTKQFNITNYISFNSTRTRSGTSNKLTHLRHLNNLSRHSYFHRLPGLWNAIPIIDLNQSFEVIKSKLKIHFWNHFVGNLHVTT